jgi:hypothetical protein
MLTMQLTEARENLEHIDLFPEVETASKAGLGPCRDQDRPIQFRILMMLVDTRTSILNSKLKHRNGPAGRADAEAALELARKAKLPPADVAQAYGGIGLAWFFSSVPLQAADMAKSKEALQEAVRIAPGHWQAWKWKSYLATIRGKEPARTLAEEASRLADTYRLYREAEEGLSAREAGEGGRLSAEEVEYKKFISRYRGLTETPAKPALVQQIDDPAQAENPERLKWQLSYAEMLAVRKEELPKARKVFADAEKVILGLPTSEQAFYKPQMQRVVKLFKAAG